MYIFENGRMKIVQLITPNWHLHQCDLYLDLEFLEDFPVVPAFGQFDEQPFQLEDYDDFLQNLTTDTDEKKDSAQGKSKKEKRKRGDVCKPALRKTMQEKRDEVNTRERNRRRALARWKYNRQKFHHTSHPSLISNKGIK